MWCTARTRTVRPLTSAGRTWAPWAGPSVSSCRPERAAGQVADAAPDGGRGERDGDPGAARAPGVRALPRAATQRGQVAAQRAPRRPRRAGAGARASRRCGRAWSRRVAPERLPPAHADAIDQVGGDGDRGRVAVADEPGAVASPAGPASSRSGTRRRGCRPPGCAGSRAARSAWRTARATARRPPARPTGSGRGRPGSRRWWRARAARASPRRAGRRPARCTPARASSAAPPSLPISACTPAAPMVERLAWL